jgi:UDP-2,3-diacylglucosamine hydrolase
MSDKPAFVVSDIHLGGVPESTERAFRRFLVHVEEHASELLINGDLFDFWFEYSSVIHSEHFRVVAALADLIESGVPVRFSGGNHDAWGGSFLRDRVGIELLDERAELEVGGFRALVVHGDGLGSGDLKYRALKKLLRSRMATRGFRLIHPDIGSWIASRVSTTKHKAGNARGASPDRAAKLREWAIEELRRDSTLDLVLTGHTHTPAVEAISPGRFYVNTGDWINHFTYLVLRPGGTPELRTWTG